jgi:hypothetical protein
MAFLMSLLRATLILMFGMDSASSLAFNQQFSRRATLALLPSIIPLSVSAAPTLRIHIDRAADSLGLEVADVLVGTPPRNVVAIKRFSSSGLAARQVPSLQPGMLIKDYPTSKTLVERLQKGPYPIDLELVNLAASGDAIGDMGRPLLGAEEALSLALSTPTSEAVAPAKGFTRRTLRTPRLCNVQSRRGDLLEITYEARIHSRDGPVFDSSLQRGTGQPYQFVLGSGDLIAGVDIGLYDMCAGEQRELDIPPVLGFGAKGNRLFGIPNGSRLVWKVELVSINSVREGDERTRDELEGRFDYWPT